MATLTAPLFAHNSFQRTHPQSVWLFRAVFSYISIPIFLQIEARFAEKLSEFSDGSFNETTAVNDRDGDG